MAIQLYLCEKYDKDNRISFKYDSDEYWESVEWMTWMQSGIGPMQGQGRTTTAVQYQCQQGSVLGLTKAS